MYTGRNLRWLKCHATGTCRVPIGGVPIGMLDLIECGKFIQRKFRPVYRILDVLIIIILILGVFDVLFYNI